MYIYDPERQRRLMFESSVYNGSLRIGVPLRNGDEENVVISSETYVELDYPEFFRGKSFGDEARIVEGVNVIRTENLDTSTFDEMLIREPSCGEELCQKQGHVSVKVKSLFRKNNKKKTISR